MSIVDDINKLKGTQSENKTDNVKKEFGGSVGKNGTDGTYGFTSADTGKDPLLEKNNKKEKTPKVKKEKAPKKPKEKKNGANAPKTPKAPKVKYAKSQKILRNTIILCVLAAIFVGLSCRLFFAYSSSAAEIKEDLIVRYTDEDFEKMQLAYDEYCNKSIEGYRHQASDIANMSKFDKYEAGLLVEDGSDSDMDGLTDQEEIEIYGSDPRKYSTADDLYSDKQKVDMGLDPCVFHEYEGEIIFPNCQCDEFILSPDSAKNLNAVISDVTGSVMDQNIKDAAIIRHYEVFGYEGLISINLGKLPSEIGMYTPNDICVYWGRWGADELTLAPTTSFGNVIEPTLYMSNGIIYEIYLMDATTVPTVFGSPVDTVSLSGSSRDDIPVLTSEDLFGFSLDLGLDDDENVFTANLREQGDEAGYDPGFLCFKLFTDTKVYYTDPRYVNEATRKNLALISEKLHGDEPEYVRVSKTDMLDKYERYLTYLDMFHFDVASATVGSSFDMTSILWYWATWFDYNDYAITMNLSNALYGGYNKVDPKSEEKDDAKNDRHLEFDVNKDALNFKNFTLKLNDWDVPANGVCEGFAMVTAKVFNNGFIDPLINNPDGNTTLSKYPSYDLTKYPLTRTFKDKGLYDLNLSFTPAAVSVVNEDDVLDGGEKEVMKLLGCYWEYGNAIDINWDTGWDVNKITPSDDMESALLDYLPNGEILDKLVNYLDSGKIAIMGLPMYLYEIKLGAAPCGYHAMNVIGYEKTTANSSEATVPDSYSGDEYVFYIYDCNNPGRYRYLFAHELIYNNRKFFVYDLSKYVTLAPDLDFDSPYSVESSGVSNNMTVFDPNTAAIKGYHRFTISDENAVSLYEY